MPNISIVGSGVIGQQFALIFASSPLNRVILFDVDSQQVEKALAFCRERLLSYEKDGYLRGSGSAEEQLSRITSTHSLEECLKEADYVQECTPEVLDLKKKIFEQLDELAQPDCLLCSSTSCIMPSLFTESLKHRGRALVAHPVNPPYFLPLMELVPAPWTSQDAMEKAKEVFEAVGQKPVALKKEIDGFVTSRLQMPILNAAWNLVESGVVSVEDVDKVMRYGLGPRFAFYGPLATFHMNSNGLDHCMECFKETLLRVSADLGPNPDYGAETLQRISQELNALIPKDNILEERKMRDKMLAEIALLKKKFV